MPSSYPAAPDDLSAGNTSLTHGEVSDAVAAVQATLGVNPQGASATVAARLDDRPALLTGDTPPASGSGIDPLDGINDPWRFSPMLGGWVVAAYEATWADGDMLPHIPAVDRGAATRFDVTVSTTFTTLAEAAAGDVAARGSYAVADSDPTDTDPAATISGAGSGSVLVIQSEADFGHTTVPEITFDPTDALFVGPLVIGAPIAFDETGDGQDGDYWRVTTAIGTNIGLFYGPKTAGAWGNPIGKLLDPAEYQIVTEPWFFRGGTGEAEAPIQMTNGLEPADIDISDGDIAFWYEATEAAPVLHFKAKDAAGAVFVAELPMTPA